MPRCGEGRPSGAETGPSSTRAAKASQRGRRCFRRLSATGGKKLHEKMAGILTNGLARADCHFSAAYSVLSGASFRAFSRVACRLIRGESRSNIQLGDQKVRWRCELGEILQDSFKQAPIHRHQHAWACSSIAPFLNASTSFSVVSRSSASKRTAACSAASSCLRSHSLSLSPRVPRNMPPSAARECTPAGPPACACNRCDQDCRAGNPAGLPRSPLSPLPHRRAPAEAQYRGSLCGSSSSTIMRACTSRARSSSPTPVEEPRQINSQNKISAKRLIAIVLQLLTPFLFPYSLHANLQARTL